MPAIPLVPYRESAASPPPAGYCATYPHDREKRAIQKRKARSDAQVNLNVLLPFWSSYTLQPPLHATTPFPSLSQPLTSPPVPVQHPPFRLHTSPRRVGHLILPPTTLFARQGRGAGADSAEASRNLRCALCTGRRRHLCRRPRLDPASKTAGLHHIPNPRRGVVLDRVHGS